MNNDEWIDEYGVIYSADRKNLIKCTARITDNFFGKYYNEQFQEDLRKFFMKIPDHAKFYKDWEDKQTFSISYLCLTDECNYLDFLTTNQNKVNFGVALFFTILIDEVFYTYYKANYEIFRQLTRFPKFIENYSWCACHLHPKEVFSAMRLYQSDYRDTFCNAVPIMEREIKDFFHKNMPKINEQEFWDKCKSEFPLWWERKNSKVCMLNRYYK